MSKWKEVKVSDVVEIIGGGTPKTTNPEFWDGNIPWLSIEDFNNDDRFVSKTVKTITDKGLEQSSTKLLNKGDLIISARGTVGKLAQLDKPMAFNQSCYGLRGKSQIINNGYLYYALKTAICSLQNAGHGAVFNTITRDTFEIVSIPVPSQDVQDEIENILGSLDQKIELNQRMSETLEGMARSIFKSWFVDFDPIHAKAEGRPPTGMNKSTAALFPDSFNDEGIPDSWQEKPLSEIGEVKTGKTPPTKDTKNYGNDLPFITIPDMHGKIYVLNSSKYLSDIGEATQKNKTLPAGTICVSCIASPGLVVLTHQECQTNQQINSVVPFKEGFESFRFWQIKEVSEDVISIGSGGSVFHNLNKSQFSELKVIEPSLELAQIYENTVSSFMLKILENEKQNQNLACLRDTILPKLISGDLRVEDTAPLLKEAV